MVMKCRFVMRLHLVLFYRTSNVKNLQINGVLCWRGLDWVARFFYRNVTWWSESVGFGRSLFCADAEWACSRVLFGRGRRVFYKMGFGSGIHLFTSQKIPKSLCKLLSVIFSQVCLVGASTPTLQSSFLNSQCLFFSCDLPEGLDADVMQHYSSMRFRYADCREDMRIAEKLTVYNSL